MRPGTWAASRQSRRIPGCLGRVAAAAGGVGAAADKKNEQIGRYVGLNGLLVHVTLTCELFFTCTNYEISR